MPKSYASFIFKVLIISILGVFFSCQSHSSTSFLYTPSSTIAIDADDTTDSVRIKAAHVVPTENQYQALKDEFIAFVHFGPNTFTRMEWGTGTEDPGIFNLQNLDTDQWCQAMQGAGMKKVIITAKHHDGFVLWQSRYTRHGIMSSPYKNGKGDILKELAASCKKYGIKLGVYLSPADLFQIESKNGLYGNLSAYTQRTIPRKIEGRPFKNKTTFDFVVDDYNEYFLNQLFELLTEYGPIDEVWFDGAHPKRKGGQTYRYTDWKVLIKALAPNAVVFGKEDIRWCGNEAGATRSTEWNVIPYKEDPNTMNSFEDITDEDVGSLAKLEQGNYVHYQPAETNTSIREGWFYRDDTEQKVRNADDVFDIYERSVGGNSIFLLNIPPNREGLFSDEDVAVLTETGRRIQETYTRNLAATSSAPKALVDGNKTTFLRLQGHQPMVEIQLDTVQKMNRFMVQEAIQTHGERVSKHAVDVWLDGAWKEVARATNIGYKRILRFPEVQSSKIRLRILESRFTPAISSIGIYYYRSRPPQLHIQRGADGHLSIQPKMNTFGWKPHGENAAANLNKGFQIRYTTDGSIPTLNATLYKAPFSFANGTVTAMSFLKEQQGSPTRKEIGIQKTNWKLLANHTAENEHAAILVADEDANTYWKASLKDLHPSIGLDLGQVHTLGSFAYTPPTNNKDGMIEQGSVYTSVDGLVWTKIDTFYFGNLINNPTQRKHTFKRPIDTRYIKIEATKIAGNGKEAKIAELDFYIH